MQVDVEYKKGGLCCITLVGEMTINYAMELKDKLLPLLAQCDSAELALSAVTEIDTAGLQLLIMAKTEARVHGKTLAITDHSPVILNLLDLCDLEGLFGDNVLIDPEEQQRES